MPLIFKAKKAPSSSIVTSLKAKLALATKSISMLNGGAYSIVLSNSGVNAFEDKLRQQPSN